MRVDRTHFCYWGFAPYDERKFVGFMTRLGVTLMPAQVKAGYLLFDRDYHTEGVEAMKKEWGDSLILNESPFVQHLFWVWRKSGTPVKTGLREFFVTPEGVTLAVATGLLGQDGETMSRLAADSGEEVVVDGLYASTTIFHPDGRMKILSNPWGQGLKMEDITKIFSKRSKAFGQIPGVKMDNFDLWDKVKAVEKKVDSTVAQPVRAADTCRQKRLVQMANCKPFSWADVLAADFGRCLYDNEGATKFVPSQIVADGEKYRVVVKGEVMEELGGYTIIPDQHYSDRTGTSSSAELTSEDEAVKAYYAISYAVARKNLPWPPPSQFRAEFMAAGLISSNTCRVAQGLIELRTRGLNSNTHQALRRENYPGLFLFKISMCDLQTFNFLLR